MRLIAALLLALAFSAPANADGFEAHRTGLQGPLDRYNEALTSAKVDRVLDLYSEAPVFIPEYAPAAVGRAAVGKAYEWVFSTLKLNGRFQLHEGEVDGDRAWIRTSSTGRFTVIATGVEAEFANSELFLLRQERGSWRIHRYMFTSSLPLPRN
jgi:ketosteroid isomerase-like protein